MKPLLVVLVVVILVVGGVAGYLSVSSLNLNKGKGNVGGNTITPMKIISLSSSINPYESSNASFFVPWSDLSFPQIPYFNATVYSSVSANVKMFVTSPTGTVLSMISEPFIKYQNLSYPSGFSDFFKDWAFFEKPGNYVISVEVFLNSTILFKNLTETINPAVNAGNITGPAGNVPFNSTLTYTATGAHYGVLPYSYYWYIQSNQSGEWMDIELIKNRTSIELKPTAPGFYNISLYVIDSLGYTSYSSLIINVIPPPVILIIPEYSQIDVGIVDNFTVDVSGGVSPFLYNWYIYYDSSVVSKGSSMELSYNFTKTGNYLITVTVRDALGENVSTSFKITVNPIPNFNLSMEYLVIDNGMIDYVNITAHGGTQYSNLTVNGTKQYFGHYYYIEYINGENIGGYNPLNVGANKILLSSIYGLPPPGVYRLNFFVYDYFYGDNFTVNLTVNGDLSSNITAIPSGNYSVNETVILSANYTGGTGPYNFTWTITWLNGSDTLYGPTVKFNITYSDYYIVQLVVTDAFGAIFFEGENIDYYYIYVQ